MKTLLIAIIAITSMQAFAKTCDFVCDVHSTNLALPTGLHTMKAYPSSKMNTSDAADLARINAAIACEENGGKLQDPDRDQQICKKTLETKDSPAVEKLKRKIRENEERLRSQEEEIRRLEIDLIEKEVRYEALVRQSKGS